MYEITKYTAKIYFTIVISFILKKYELRNDS